MECWRGLLRLDVGCSDDLAPFLGFIGDQLAEVGRRSCEHRAAQIGEPRLNVGIGENRVDFLVEPLDDLNGRVFGRTDPAPETNVVARQEVGRSGAPRKLSTYPGQAASKDGKRRRKAGMPQESAVDLERRLAQALR